MSTTYQVRVKRDGAAHRITVCLPQRFAKASEAQCHRAVAASVAKARHGGPGLHEIRKLGPANVVLRYGFLSV